MSEIPKNWQAVARAIISDLDAEIGKMLTVRYGMHWAISLRNYDLYRCILDRLEVLGHDRPKHNEL